MADFSDPTAKFPASVADALTFNTARTDATDRDSATPDQVAAEHLTRINNEIIAVQQHVLDGAGVPNLLLTVGAEANGTISVTVQVRDAANANIAEFYAIHAWLSDSQYGGETGSTPGETSWSTGSVLEEITAGERWVVLTDTNGTAVLAVTYPAPTTTAAPTTTGAGTTAAPTTTVAATTTQATVWYLNAEIHGEIFVSGSITLPATTTPAATT